MPGKSANQTLLFNQLLKLQQKNNECCSNFLTTVFTEDSESVSFTGSGTKNDPLIAQTHALGAPLPTVFNDTFNRTSLGNNYEVDGTGMTATFPTASYINIQGPGGPTNFLKYNYYTCAEYFTLNVRYRNNVISSTSNGITLGVISNHPLGTSVSFYAQLNQNTGNANLGKITANGSRTSTTSIPQPSVGDIINMTIVRTNVFYKTTVLNETTGATTSFISFASPNGTPIFVNNTSRPSIGFLGGDVDILGFSYTVNEYQSPSIMLIGDSVTGGEGTSIFANSFANRLNGGYRFIVNMSGNADYSAVILQRLPEVISLAPKNVYLMFGGNDLLFGVPFATLQANYQAFVNGLEAAGINVFHLLATPRNATDVTPLNNWLIATYPNTYIDTYLPLWAGSGTSLNSFFDFGDGLHPNDLGHATLAFVIQSSGKLPF